MTKGRLPRECDPGRVCRHLPLIGGVLGVYLACALRLPLPGPGYRSMTHDPPKPRKTQRLSSQEIERMRAAAEAGQCVECARRQGTIEEQRQELHRLHKEVGALQATQEIIVTQVRILAAKVEEMSR